MGGIGAIVRTMSAVSNRVQRCSKSVIFILCSIGSPHAIVLPFITAGMLLERGMTLLVGFRIASNISKDADAARFLYRQDQTEVCTLSGWVSPRVRPYPPYYRAAFAFSVISYPLLHPPSLRSGYHVCGGHRAYPVVNEEDAARVGWSLYPGEPVGCRHPQPGEVAQLTYHFGDGLSASFAILVSRGFTRTLHVRSTFPAFPSPPPPRGW